MQELTKDELQKILAEIQSVNIKFPVNRMHMQMMKTKLTSGIQPSYAGSNQTTFTTSTSPLHTMAINENLVMVDDDESAGSMTSSLYSLSILNIK